MPDELWSFPRNLADEANAKGWFQADVAEKAGVSQATVSRWMQYDIEPLKVLDVIRLEAALGLEHGALTLPATVLRARRRDVDVVAHDSVPPGEVRELRRIAEHLGGKQGRQPKRGTRSKRG